MTSLDAYTTSAPRLATRTPQHKLLNGGVTRAVGITAPGGPEVLSVFERPVPEPGPGDVRVAVQAAAVNRADIFLRTNGNPDVPAPWIPGLDAAGSVDAVGAGVERLYVGQQVMAVVDAFRAEGGAQTELLVVSAASVVPIPAGATLQQASTLPMTGLTAKLGLELLALRSGETLGVTGGAGLLASYVIPLAKRAGLRVIADAKPEDEELVRGYGADTVVSRGERFVASVREAEPEGVHGLYDTAVLNDAAIGAIRDGGAIAVVGGWKPAQTERNLRIEQVFVPAVYERTDWLQELRQLASDRRLQLRVLREYPPEQAAEAHRRMEAGGLRGRDVITF
ncbi:MAG TPA: NADP-dependent oxidoreductase [Solirubrobacteraceae bacterium]|jgi:NADPH:quinone reductase-like Zn-dependent oxidoreductase